MIDSSKTKVISTGYVPRPLQKTIHSSVTRFNILVAHRRFGKTVLCINHIIDRALKNLLRNPQYAYIAPTYKQAKIISWQYLVDFTRNIPGVKPNKSEACVYIHRDWRVDPITGEKDPDFIKIMLIGSDDPDSLRGLYLDGGIFDEYAQCNPIVWGEIMRPALADRAKLARETALKVVDPNVKRTLLNTEPWAIFIGTPKGVNHFYRRYMKAKANEQFAASYERKYNIQERKEIFTNLEKELGIDDDTSMNRAKELMREVPAEFRKEYNEYRKYLASKEWFTAIYRANETGILSRDEIEAMSEDLEPEEVDQELNCSFNAAIRGAYFSKQLYEAREDDRVTHVPYDTAYPVDTFWDLGINDSMTIWFVQRKPQGWFYIDYYSNSGEGVEEYLKILIKKNYLYGRNIWPHDGKERDLITGKTRLHLVRNLGKPLGLRFEVQERTSNQSQIQAARNRISMSWFDEINCQQGLDCLYNFQKQWDDKLQVFKDKPVHDWASHGSKSFCYSALDDRISKFEYKRQREMAHGMDVQMEWNEFS